MTTAPSAPPAPPDAPAYFRLERVGVSFGAVEAIREVTLTVAPGEFVALVGPSGCGKSTLLSLLSGSLAPTRGRAERAGRTRTVHQSDGLFPWRTVSQNIALGLPPGTPDAAAEGQVNALLAMIGLEAFADHYPHQLSGGMRQRVEIARALAGEGDARSAEALLLDEPFSALDYLTRLKMRRELTHLLARRPRTVVLVTHDIEEAAQLADRVVVLSERPATVRFTLELGSPRPREVTQPDVTAAIGRILGAMGLGRPEAVPSSDR